MDRVPKVSRKLVQGKLSKDFLHYLPNFFAIFDDFSNCSAKSYRKKKSRKCLFNLTFRPFIYGGKFPKKPGFGYTRSITNNLECLNNYLDKVHGHCLKDIRCHPRKFFHLQTRYIPFDTGIKLFQAC